MAGDLKYDLNHVMDYSGSILIANGFIDKYFVPFGFQLPHAFRKVYELTFRHGLFVRVEDKSEAARMLRIEYEEPDGQKEDADARRFVDAQIGRIRLRRRNDRPVYGSELRYEVSLLKASVGPWGVLQRRSCRARQAMD